MRGVALPDQLDALRTIVRTSREVLYRAIENLKGLAAASQSPATIPFARPSKRGIEEPAEAGTTSAGIRSVHLPPPPAPAPVWTEADFETDPRVRHLLADCPVLAELKRVVDEHRRPSHEEQLVLIHTLGHLEGGPLAVKYLFDRCVDIGPEKRKCKTTSLRRERPDPQFVVTSTA